MSFRRVSLLLLGVLTSMACHGEPLRLCFEDVEQRPWSLPDGTGLNFELLRRAARQLNEEFVYQAKPWKRCLSELRLGQVDGVVGAAYAPERRSFARIPQLGDGREDPARALFADHALVFLRNGGQASWDGRRINSPDRIVVVQAGYLVAQMLREQGYRPHEQVKSAADGLRMLTTGSYDVAVLQGMEAARLAAQDVRFRGRVRLVAPPFTSIHLHLMVANKVYEANPARIEAIWDAIGAVRHSAEYRQLEAAAGVADDYPQ